MKNSQSRRLGGTSGPALHPQERFWCTVHFRVSNKVMDIPTSRNPYRPRYDHSKPKTTHRRGGMSILWFKWVTCKGS